MSNIRIDLVSEFKDRGFKNAEKSIDKLNRSFTNLQRTAVKTFVAVAGVRALRNSVRAFADEDRAVQNLTQSLKNLGLGYNVGAIENFISATQAATGVSDSELRPAMVELVQVTLDAQKATSLLNSAMDLSAGTGTSLNASIRALSRAYNGNYTALGRLQRVYTAAQLEAMGFDQAVIALNDTFGGTAAANADSYGGKIARLNVAVDEARETIGKGLIDAFETLADGDFDKVIDAIAASARGLAGFMRNVAYSIEYTKALLKTGWTIGRDEQAQLDMIRQQWMSPRDTSNTAAANRVFLRDMKSQLALQKKIASERSKSAKLSGVERKNQTVLSRARSMFDLEKIQIEAALKGKITEEERIRLELMKAITNENATAAEDLVKKLKQVQEENAKLATQLTTFPKANDPFIEWGKSLDGVMGQLTAIAQKRIVVDFIANFTPTSTAAITAITGPSTASAAIAAATSPAASAVSSAKAADVAVASAEASSAAAEAAEASANAVIAQEEAAKVLASAILAEDVKAAEVLVKAADEAAAAAIVQTEAAAALEYAAAILALQEANMIASESVSLAQAVGVPSVEITVNVAGNVTAEQDLAETIYDTFLGYQKSGKGLLYQAVAI